ncbi:MAG: chemotaxis protein CheW [Marinilabiliaceae bacterium]|nr:chemotaxis protein CheW [Marinilabiliaceae bacterium]
MNEELNTIISFQAADEQFAFNALIVRHILELGKITRIPNVPEYLLGVINLHGNIIPVADFRMMIGAELVNRTKDTSIIVISPNNQVESYIGLVVDMVNEVIPINPSQITPSIIDQNLGMVDSFDGTIRLNEQFIHLVNIDALVQKIEDVK